MTMTTVTSATTMTRNRGKMKSNSLDHVNCPRYEQGLFEKGKSFVLFLACYDKREFLKPSFLGACGSIKWKKTLSCKLELRIGLCDDYCSLCNCATDLNFDWPQHCNDKGECQATCDDDNCYNAKCKCEYGWTGDKCEIPRKYYEIIL